MSRHARGRLASLGVLALVAVALSPAGAAAGQPVGPERLEGLLYNHGRGCLDPPETGGSPPGTGLRQYNTCIFDAADNQEFAIVDHWSGGAAGSGRYLGATIENLASGLCADVDGEQAVPAGTQVILFGCNATEADNQLFTLEQVAETAAGQPLHLVVHRKSGLCLDVAGYRTTGNNLAILLNPCDVDDDHLWAVI